MFMWYVSTCRPIDVPVSSSKASISCTVLTSTHIRVSQGWNSCLMARYAEDGEAAYEPRSRRPRSNRTATPPESRVREDDELLGRSGHRDIAVDRSFEVLTERFRVDDDDQVELEPLRQLRGE